MPVDHPAMLWATEHAGEFLTKRSVGHDGRTPFECLSGKPSWDESCEGFAKWRTPVSSRWSRA
eukprot:3058044-Alexandrium_andersonii.AAC.1